MVYDCAFNPAVGCADRAGCSRCGWNPDVTEKRKAKKKTAPDGANIEDGGPEGQQSSTPSV